MAQVTLKSIGVFAEMIGGVFLQQPRLFNPRAQSSNRCAMVRLRWSLSLGFAIAFLSQISVAAAQLPAPAPTASALPAPTPTDPITPSWDQYRVANTPTATIGLTLPNAQTAAPSQNRSVKVLGAANPVPGGRVVTTLLTEASDGIMSEVNLGRLADSNLPPPAAVALQFGASAVGAQIWVQPLDSGVLQTKDENGRLVSAAGGIWLVIDARGQASFTFQAPARSFRYQVLIRLGNVSTILPFVVPDPTLDD